MSATRSLGFALPIVVMKAYAAGEDLIGMNQMVVMVSLVEVTTILV